MRPALILAVIAGGMAGIATLVALGGGLVSAASPGSIFAILALTPRDGFLANIAAVIVAAAVSFAVSALILRGATYTEDDLAAAQSGSREMKGGAPAPAAAGVAAGTGTAPTLTSDLSELSAQPVRKVVFACDAGMGSSAMGATGFRRKVQAAGLPIEVTNTSIENIPSDADIVVTQQNLTSRARTKQPGARHVSIDNFVGNPIYDRMIDELKTAAAGTGAAAVMPTAAPVQVVTVPAETSAAAPAQSVAAPTPTTPPSVPAPAPSGGVLRRENVQIGLASEGRDAAIRRAGEALVRSGYVNPNYVPAMLEREELVSTYIGNGVAIPHGVDAAKPAIKASGIVVHQYPQGVDFDGQTAYLVIGIAGQGNDHMEILSKIATVLEDEQTVMRLAQTTDADELYRTLSAG
ncbi:PTS sugar transporter subunit IIA [Deinococcus radiophilus]